MPDRDKLDKLQITINAEVFNTKTNSLIKLWEESPIRPYILKCSKGILQQPRILLFIVFLFLFIFYSNTNEENIDKNGGEIKIQDVDMLTKIIPTEGDG